MGRLCLGSVYGVAEAGGLELCVADLEAQALEVGLYALGTQLLHLPREVE